MGLTQLGQQLAEAFTGKDLKLALAESCTGGLVADSVTDVAGSSAYFVGGVVAYANEAKENLLGVPTSVIAEHGAVSEAVALAMARGIRARLGADVSLAITGIAGPGGATPHKPVGLVWLAVVGPWGERAQSFQARGDRLANKRRFAEEALGAILAYLRAVGG
ncbi:MAG: CinA family protein [Chloroflexota bacterium]